MQPFGVLWIAYISGGLGTMSCADGLIQCLIRSQLLPLARKQLTWANSSLKTRLIVKLVNSSCSTRFSWIRHQAPFAVAQAKILLFSRKITRSPKFWFEPSVGTTAKRGAENMNCFYQWLSFANIIRSSYFVNGDKWLFWHCLQLTNVKRRMASERKESWDLLFKAHWIGCNQATFNRKMEATFRWFTKSHQTSESSFSFSVNAIADSNHKEISAAICNGFSGLALRENLGHVRPHLD